MAQANILNAKKPEEIGIRTEEQKSIDNDAPLEYGYVDDRDILWSKTVWETIDLDERVNFPLYYPTDTVDIGSDRRSLYQVLIRNLKNGNLEDVYVDADCLVGMEEGKGLAQAQVAQADIGQRL